jgi:hypothetical protein
VSQFKEVIAIKFGPTVTVAIKDKNSVCELGREAMQNGT